jgi:outer membrane protein OmpA-like peptidoglycan-associated protein
MKTVSYGKEVPLCTDHTEDCQARNRRAHFPVTSKLNR